MSPTTSAVNGGLAQAAAKRSKNKIHHARVTGTVTGTGENQVLTIPLPMKDLDKSSQGTGARATLGISLTVKFDHQGREYQLHTGFLSLTCR